MSDKTTGAGRLQGAADREIVGINPGPWNPADPMSWPTVGYDNGIIGMAWEHPEGSFAWAEFTREEWLGLADEMVRRWTEWRAHCAALPDDG